MTECSICLALEGAGVSTHQSEMGPEASHEALERVIRFKEGNDELYRCPTCGAFYRYTYHYEFLANQPSEETYCLWKLQDEAQDIVRSILAEAVAQGDKGSPDESLSSALRHASPHRREYGALLFLHFARQWKRMPKSVAAMAALYGPPRPAPGLHNTLYDGLLTYIESGSDRAAEVLHALEESKAAEHDTTASWVGTNAVRLLQKAREQIAKAAAKTATTQAATATAQATQHPQQSDDKTTATPSIGTSTAATTPAGATATAKAATAAPAVMWKSGVDYGSSFLARREADDRLRFIAFEFDERAGCDATSADLTQSVESFVEHGPSTAVLARMDVALLRQVASSLGSRWPGCIHPKDGDLIEAVRAGDATRVLAAMTAGASPNANDAKGVTALGHAAISRQNAIAMMLLSAGADPDLRFGAQNETPLHQAAELRNLELVRALISKKANVNARRKNDVSVLAAAVLGRYAAPDAQTKFSLDLIKELIAAGAHVNARAEGGRTPLMTAAGTGDQALVDLLLRSGADIRARDDNGRDVLANQLSQCKEANVSGCEMCDHLIELGADVNAADQWGDTPLMHATNNDNVRLVKRLIEADARVETANKRGVTVIKIADRFPRVYKLLASFGKVPAI